MEIRGTATGVSGHRKSRQSGTALLAVLSVLTVLSILVLAFVASMRLESTSSNAVEESYRAKMVANGALSHAVELLRSNIPDPVSVTEIPGDATGWATNPGRLTLFPPNEPVVHVPLHSGAAPNPEEDVAFDARSTDLNRPLPGRSRAPIANGDPDTPRPEMWVAWIPVLEDPSVPAAPDNRMVARYAFWVDDETSKLNTSTALGKPDPDDLDTGVVNNWREQMEAGWVTPVFAIQNEGSGNGAIRVSLGHPWSVNFDTLFEGDLPIDLWALYHEQRIHGFQRYPDAILKFIDLPEDEKRLWYDQNLWNITFYSRAPEFNAFGFSRQFLLSRPAALMSGPSYQAPFTVNGNDFFQGLYGFPMQAGAMPVDSEERIQLNDLTLASGKTLIRYLEQRCPGMDESFVDRYGSEEARQMVLNLLMMSRFATGDISGPNGYGNCISSMNYGGENETDAGTPERFYWRVNDQFEFDSNEPPMLPQTPGPHINEIKFVVTPVETVRGGDRVFRLRYHYEIEYYLHEESPFALGSDTPDPNLLRLPLEVKVDYLKLEVDGHEQTFDDEDWDSTNLQRLACQNYPRGQTTEILGPYEVVRSSGIFLTSDEGRAGEGSAVIFDPLTEPEVTFKVNLRLGSAIVGGGVKQMVPLGIDPDDTLEAEISIDLTFPEPEYFVSWEIEDPRVSWHKDDWTLREGEDSMGQANSNQPQDPEASEYQSFKYIKLMSANLVGNSNEELGDRIPVVGYGNEIHGDSRMPSSGYLSMLHTGIRNREPWSTLDLSAQSSGFRDWVLLDLLGATYPMQRALIGRSLPDHWLVMSYMNSTAGKVNLNNKVYPDNQWFDAPERTQPLKAVFRYLRDDPDVDALVDSILDWQDQGDSFQYVGQLSEVDEYAVGSSDWENELLLRNMANCLTTQSNTFGVWGVAQTITKARSSILPDQFEELDSVDAEKRFYALVERYVWPGRDGLPGNGHLDDSGSWDRLADPPEPTVSENVPGDLPQMNVAGTFATMDGPDSVNQAQEELFAEVPYTSSTLAEADNPPHALIKYRVLYFKYLDH